MCPHQPRLCQLLHVHPRPAARKIRGGYLPHQQFQLSPAKGPLWQLQNQVRRTDSCLHDFRFLSGGRRHKNVPAVPPFLSSARSEGRLFKTRAKRSRSRARPDLSGQATTKVRISHHRSLRLAIAVAHEGRNKSISVQVARHLFSMNAPRSAFTTLSTRNLCLQYPTSPPKKMGGHNHRTVFNFPH